MSEAKTFIVHREDKKTFIAHLTDKTFTIHNEEEAITESASALGDASEIEASRNVIFFSREEIKNLVEKPLLSACEMFYDKNVRTLSSSANSKDVASGGVYIIIDYTSLSENNKLIAEKYASPQAYDETQAVKIIKAVNNSTTVEEIEQWAMAVAQSFEAQDALWIPEFTLTQIKQIYRIDPSNTELDDPSIWQAEGYYYDSEKDIYYFSEEHYLKKKQTRDPEPWHRRHDMLNSG